ncbi:hypothetical protein PANDA_019827 [Ailuropoda melanoleuca]|uniref:Uncharacterized protein n=1 Tax=Ailuropoda melanoleuca TaxID=9646 RepID=D2I2Z3_AILME|nr:hypothetical protein PANDA_019827 [Ailuropoda melanoleuca]
MLTSGCADPQQTPWAVFNHSQSHEIFTGTCGTMLLVEWSLFRAVDKGTGRGNDFLKHRKQQAPPCRLGAALGPPCGRTTGPTVLFSLHAARRDHYAYSYYPSCLTLNAELVQVSAHTLSADSHPEVRWRLVVLAIPPASVFCGAGGLLFVVLLPRDQRSGGVTEASSLLGGSPRRPCGRKGSPYHTGQLHPAVRVADLLQHINQMKTAEGYGFKQEYEDDKGQVQVWSGYKSGSRPKEARHVPRFKSLCQPLGSAKSYTAQGLPPPGSLLAKPLMAPPN